MKRFFFFFILFSFFVFFPKTVFGQNTVGCCEVSNESGIQCVLVSSKKECLENYAAINPKYFENYICDDLRTYRCIPLSSSGDQSKSSSEDKFYFQVPFPGSQEIENASADVRLLEYLVLIFKLGVWFAVFLAIFMIMVAGFLYLTAGGSSERVSRAKEFVGGALSGLVIALFSFVILQTINPRLVELSFPEIPGPRFDSDQGGICCYNKKTEKFFQNVTLLADGKCSSLDSLYGPEWIPCAEAGIEIGPCCVCNEFNRFKYDRTICFEGRGVTEAYCASLNPHVISSRFDAPQDACMYRLESCKSFKAGRYGGVTGFGYNACEVTKTKN